MENKWFKARSFGWGWQPCSWQGWAVTLVFFVIILVMAFLMENYMTEDQTVFALLFPLAICTAAFIRIAHATGEKPEWRWNGKPMFKNKDK